MKCTTINMKTGKYIHSLHRNSMKSQPFAPIYHVTLQVAISTTPPLSPNEHGALDFKYWVDVGYDMLITSNINNWYVLLYRLTIQCS